MATMYIMRGWPASGKSTYAKAWVAQDPINRMRVNRDTLRLMAHDGKHIKPSRGNNGTEWIIIAMRNAIIDVSLGAGMNVIVDDTNLPDGHVAALQARAERKDANVEVVDFRHVPIDVCIDRDAKRPEHERVGAEVILDMFSKYGT